MIRVLYIDDEADTEKMSSKFELLARHGIQVIPVMRVQDAIPTLDSAGNIELIVLDIIMPPEDSYTLDETDGGTTTGLKLLQDIRKQHAEVPILIVSIRRMQVAEELMKQLKVKAYLEKPVSSITIANAIKKALQNSP